MYVTKKPTQLDTCACGKLKFPVAGMAHRHNPGQRVYYCPISSTYHLTTRAKWDSHKPPPATAGFSIKRLQRELNQMATMQDSILDYMRKGYKNNKQYKYSAAEVIDGVIQKYPQYQRNSVSAQISTMKKSGLIVDLGERVPDSRRKDSTYLALAEHLEEVTKPEPKKIEAKPVATETKSVPKPSEVKIPPQAPSPFDKVNSQLGEILSKVNGLATGYAEISQKLRPSTVEETLELLQVIAKTLHTKVSDDLNEIKSIASGHVTVDGDKLADVINARLSDLKREDSFVYVTRAIVDDRVDKLEDTLKFAISHVKPPTNYASLTDDEKYRLGIKDGIKLAVEMGIILPDA